MAGINKGAWQNDGINKGAFQEQSGTGEISGSANITFSESCNIEAEASLEAEANIAFTNSANIKADGFISGSANISFSQSCDLRNDFTSAEADIIFSATAKLEGTYPTGMSTGFNHW